MSDMEKKLRYMKLIKKGKKPDEYQHDGEDKRYKTKHDIYNAIVSIINTCDEDEVNNLEVILSGEIGSAERLSDFKGILSIFISSVSLIVSSAALFLSKIIDMRFKTVNSEQIIYLLNNSMELMLIILLIVTCIAIIGYFIIARYTSKQIDIASYLLDAIRKTRKN